MKKHSLILIGLLSSSLVVAGSIFMIFESDSQLISSLSDFLWWWVVTTSTVGYGDIVPQSAWGRIAGVYTIVIGVYTYTDIVSLIISNVHSQMTAKEKGKAAIEADDHILICNYTAFADEMLQEFEYKGMFPDKQIVMLTALVGRNPYPKYDFVYGVPISPNYLLRAHVDKASHIFVFSNARFADPDNKTLHVVSRILRLNTTAKLFVELNNPSHPLLDSLKGDIIIMKSDDLLNSAVAQRYLELERYLV